MYGTNDTMYVMHLAGGCLDCHQALKIRRFRRAGPCAVAPSVPSDPGRLCVCWILPSLCARPSFLMSLCLSHVTKLMPTSGPLRMLLVVWSIFPPHSSRAGTLSSSGLCSHVLSSERPFQSTRVKWHRSTPSVCFSSPCFCFPSGPFHHPERYVLAGGTWLILFTLRPQF